jgi:serine/threonine protein kinase
MSGKAYKENFYDILEVSPKARSGVIRAAYKVLIREYHPDTSPGNTKIAKALNEAKEILLDDKKRAAYDRERTELSDRIIGDFRVLDLIAEGGFGRTYRGEHVLLGTHVCIKHALNISPQDEAILMDEARSIWDLRHFGIPAIRDLLRLDDGSLALVMSFIPGPTLAKIIEKNESLDAEHVCWIMERIFNILKYLHYHGVVHGDVKPHNIIIQPESHTVVLVDYGLAMIKPRRDSVNVGYTPYFAPPEQVSGNVLIPRSDFYSMAMTMVYALGGDIAKKEVPASVPDALCNYLRRFLVRDVLSRPGWEHEDFTDTIGELREKIFGRNRSGMKPIPNF